MAENKESYCAVYRNVFDDTNEDKWIIHGGYKSFEKVHEAVISTYQFKGFLVDWGWFIYKVLNNGRKIKLDLEGKAEDS
jgi:hypothetical protein